MKKLTLDLDRLEIATFEPLPGELADPRGTVEALAATPYPCSAIDACPTRLCPSRDC
jgi:hypothetical protein